MKRPWPQASQACLAGGGRLATVKTLSSIQPIIEAMNLQAEVDGEFWLGARKNINSDDLIWEDGTSVDVDNWALEYRISGTWITQVM